MYLWLTQWEQKKHLKNGVINLQQSVIGAARGSFLVQSNIKREALGRFQKMQNAQKSEIRDSEHKTKNYCFATWNNRKMSKKGGYYES